MSTSILDIASNLGWGVRTLSEYSGGRYQIYNKANPDTGRTFETEDEAWDYIVAHLTGVAVYDLDDIDEVVMGKRSEYLNEMMGFTHPGLTNVESWRYRGNIYSLEQRKRGSGPSVLTMTVSIEVPSVVPATQMLSVDYRVFRVPVESLSPISQEKAMQTIYERFMAWRNESLDAT